MSTTIFRDVMGILVSDSICQLQGLTGTWGTSLDPQNVRSERRTGDKMCKLVDGEGRRYLLCRGRKDDVTVEEGNLCLRRPPTARRYVEVDGSAGFWPVVNSVKKSDAEAECGHHENKDDQSSHLALETADRLLIRGASPRPPMAASIRLPPPGPSLRVWLLWWLWWWVTSPSTPNTNKRLTYTLAWYSVEGSDLQWGHRLYSPLGLSAPSRPADSFSHSVAPARSKRSPPGRRPNKTNGWISAAGR
jgi:hypothetical protein